MGAALSGCLGRRRAPVRPQSASAHWPPPHQRGEGDGEDVVALVSVAERGAGGKLAPLAPQAEAAQAAPLQACWLPVSPEEQQQLPGQPHLAAACQQELEQLVTAALLAPRNGQEQHPAGEASAHSGSDPAGPPRECVGELLTAASSRLGRASSAAAPGAANAAGPASFAAAAGQPCASGGGAAGSGGWVPEGPRSSSCSVAGEGAAGQQRLRVHVVTFNMNGRVPPSLPPAMLGPPGGGGRAEPADLYVFATQESGPIAEWERLLSASLPAGYERVAWQTLRAMHLVLFAPPRTRRRVVSVRGSGVATGIGNVVGNKGAVALAVQLGELSLLFVGSHFAAHDHQVERRNADFHRVRTGLFRGSISGGGGGSGGGSSSRASSSGGGLPALLSLSGSSRCSSSDGGSGAVAAGGRSSQLRPLGASLWASMPAGGLSGGACAPAATGIVAPGGWTAGEWQRARGSSSSACGAAARAAFTDDGCAWLQLQPPPPLLQQQQQLLPHELPGAGSTLGDQAGAGRRERPSAAGLFESFTGGRRPSISLLQRGRPAPPADATADHDVVFWAGDLNYRINGNSRAVGYLLRARLHEVLHANDQLRLQQRKGLAFQGFQEGRIHFQPTFKLVPGGCEYDGQRVPSWTDRVLWKVRPAAAPGDAAGGARPAPPRVAQTYYASVPEVTSSDHKPVVAGFELLLEAAAAGEQDEGEEAAGPGGWAGGRCSIM